MTPTHAAASRHDGHAGFTVVEVVIALAILTVIAGTMFDGMLRLSRTNATVSNRTVVHSGVRNATELLQQEVGQAGLITLPQRVRLASAVAPGSVTVALQALTATGSVDANAQPATWLFPGAQVVVDTGPLEETVTLSTVNRLTGQVTAAFTMAHAAGAAVAVSGAFRHGILPPSITNGSSGRALKLFGDIVGDGHLVYVEYTCDTSAHRLYRRLVAFDAATKPALSEEQALLTSVLPNPDGTPCFTYQVRSVAGSAFVTDVAITLTVQTPDADPVTGLFEQETKALLNVSPRNVFNAWQMAGLGVSNRVQVTPPSISVLAALA